MTHGTLQGAITETALEQLYILTLHYITLHTYIIYIYAGELVLVPLFWPFKSQEQYH